MTAILGSSGAGKTTLLNFLSWRSTNSPLYYQGDLILNDCKVKGISNIKNLIGFVPQQDIMVDTFTVQENFKMYGRYRAKKNLNQKVSAVIKQMDLEHCKDTKVGNPFERGLSGGEKKRVSIGIELMSEPELLFLDEPTTGLDATTALEISQVLKNLNKDKGTSIVAVLHQPRPEILEMFDQVMILSEGYMIFDGSLEEIAIRLQKLRGNLPAFKAPSETLMELTDIDHIRLQLDRQFDFDHMENKFFASMILQTRVQQLRRLERDNNRSKRNSIISLVESEDGTWHTGPNQPRTKGSNDSLKEMLFESGLDETNTSELKTLIKRAKSVNCKRNMVMQFFILLYYSLVFLLKNKVRMGIIALQQIISFLMIYMVMRDLGDPTDDTIVAIQNRFGVAFLMVNYGFLSGLYSDLLTFINDKPLFMRDKDSRCYDELPYFLARQLYILPMFLALLFVLAIFFYNAMHFNPDPNLIINNLCFVFFFLVGGFLCGSSLGSVVGSLTNVFENTGIILSVIGLPLNLVSGFNMNVKGANVFIRYLAYISPQRFTFQGFMLTEFQNSQTYVDSCYTYFPCFDDPSKKCRYKIPDMYKDRCDPMKVTDFEQTDILTNMYFIIGLCIAYRIIGFIIFRLRSITSKFTYKEDKQLVGEMTSEVSG